MRFFKFQKWNQRKTIGAILSCGFGLAVFFFARWVTLASDMKVSIQFLGYTNAAPGEHSAILQISNASPFAVVRGRGPVVIFDDPSESSEIVSTGWSVLGPGDCEQIETDPTTNTMRWRLSVGCEPLGGDSYGVGEPDFRERMIRSAVWLRDHSIPVPVPEPEPGVVFSSEWIKAPDHR